METRQREREIENLPIKTGETDRDRERTNGDETVDVAAAVQGVEGDDVLPLSLSLHLDLVVVLLIPHTHVYIANKPHKSRA